MGEERIIKMEVHWIWDLALIGCSETWGGETKLAKGISYLHRGSLIYKSVIAD